MLSTILIFQLSEDHYKRGKGGAARGGNYFEVNLIHPGGPGYLETAQKSRLGFINSVSFFLFSFFRTIPLLLFQFFIDL